MLSSEFIVYDAYHHADSKECVAIVLCTIFAQQYTFTIVPAQTNLREKFQHLKFHNTTEKYLVLFPHNLLSKA